MGKSEDYLDKLLNSVTENKGKPLNDGVGYVESEDDFLNDFENELNDDDDDDFLKSFEEELNRDTPSQAEEVQTEKSSDTGKTENADDDYLKNMEKLVNDSNGESDSFDMEFDDEDDLFGMKEKVLDSPDDLQIDTISNPFSEQDDDSDLGAEDGDAAEFMDLDESEEMQNPMESADKTEDIPNLSEEDEEEDDLMKMLSQITEEEDAPEFNESSAEETDADIDDVDIEDDELLNALEDIEEKEEDSGDKKKKKRKKKEKKKSESEDGEKNGFLAKLSRALFGEEEEEIEEEPVDPKVVAAEKKALKEQKKKEKEEKKAEKKALKEQKKKEKPPKEKKPKKEKPPKPVDNTSPLPKAPVILISVMAASIGILIFLGSKLIGYTVVVSQAKDSYNAGNYIEAYNDLNGTEVKAADADLYQKSALMSYLQEEYDAYNTYMGISDYEGALDCLVRGIGRYDMHIDDAKEYGLEDQYNELETQMEQALKEQFSVSADTARDLYATQKKREYTQQLKSILKNLGLE